MTSTKITHGDQHVARKGSLSGVSIWIDIYRLDGERTVRESRDPLQSTLFRTTNDPRAILTGLRLQSAGLAPRWARPGCPPGCRARPAFRSRPGELFPVLASAAGSRGGADEAATAAGFDRQIL